MSPIITSAKLADAAALLKVSSAARRQAYSQLIPDDRRIDFEEATSQTPKNLDLWRSRIQNSINLPGKYMVIVARLDDEIVGFCRSVLRDNVLHVANLYVDPSRQSGGVGKLLLRRVLDSCKWKEASLHVLASNTAAQEFYKKQGFTVDSESPKTFYGAKRYKMLRKKR